MEGDDALIEAVHCNANCAVMPGGFIRQGYRMSEPKYRNHLLIIDALGVPRLASECDGRTMDCDDGFSYQSISGKWIPCNLGPEFSGRFPPTTMRPDRPKYPAEAQERILQMLAERRLHELTPGTEEHKELSQLLMAAGLARGPLHSGY